MRSFQKKGRWKKITQSKMFLMFLGILILIFVFSVFSFMGKMEETSKNKKIVEDKIAELEKSKEKLNEDINKLKTDEGVEENIREKFGLAKEGENMIMIIDDKNQAETPKKDTSFNLFTTIESWFRP